MLDKLLPSNALNGAVYAPIAKLCALQNACGMISPNSSTSATDNSCNARHNHIGALQRSKRLVFAAPAVPGNGAEQIVLKNSESGVGRVALTIELPSEGAISSRKIGSASIAPWSRMQ